MNKFIEYYKTIQPKIKEALNNFNQEILKEENSTIKDNLEVFAKLNESGKMVRGTLITLGYKFNKSDIDLSIPLASAYEIFETSILVHDDIIDNDDLRRGCQAIHSYNKDKYKTINNNEHLSNSIALCIGDYGLYKANNLIVDNYANKKNFKKLFNLYNETIINTIRGEIIDVALPFLEQNNIYKGNLEESIMNIYTLKTAYYSIVGPLILGMTLSDANDKQINDIKDFALPLGIVFQMQDDYLGIFSSDTKLGKTVGSDIKEFKQTLLYSYTKNTSYYDELLKHYGKNNYDLKSVQEIFIKCGAKDYIVAKMNELYEESLDKLEQIKWLKKEDKTILKDLVLYLKERDK